MPLEKDIWTDNWPDHYRSGTWAPKYRDYVKMRLSKQKDKTQTDAYRSQIHTIQPSRFQRSDDEAEEISTLKTTSKPTKSGSRTFSTTHSATKMGDRTRIKSGNRSKKSTLSTHASIHGKDNNRKQQKTLTWDPNGDFHDNDDYVSERDTRKTSLRSKSAPGSRRLREAEVDVPERRHYHDSQHQKNCDPVGVYYNQVDPWICQFCNGLDCKKKYTTHACLVDKHGTGMVCDPISLLNHERRAHLFHRRHNRKCNNADMRSVEEMAYRMNMAARSGMPVDYRNHMECKVHWRM